MLNKLVNKIAESAAKAEERRKERERLEQEKIEKEKERLNSLSEKELLIELLLKVQKVEDEHKEIIEKIESLDSTIWTNSNNYKL